MKSLVAGVVLIILVGFAGFLYRNVAENTHPGGEVACTMEAKLCPDGTGVGRVGPMCEFAPCPFPNVEIHDAHLAFAVPLGYVADENAYGADSSMLAVFVKPSESGSVMHTIAVRRYLIGEGETADDVILAYTRYQPADMQAEDFSRFSTALINGKTWRATVIERFEALVQSAYYLARENDVVIVSVTEHDVTEWMNPDLDVETLPEHQALLSLLGTLQTGE